MMEIENRQSSHKGLDSDNPAIRMGALARVFMAAPDTKVKPQDLAACLNDEKESIRILAVEALGKWGEDALPLISEALDPKQPDQVRISASSCLGRMGIKAEPAVLSLASCLESDNALLRWHAGFALSKIGSPALAELKHKLASDNPKTIMAAVQSLGWMGKKAIEAVGAIQTLGEKKNRELTILCASALVSISGNTEKGLHTLLSSLKEGDPKLTKICIQEIGLLGDRAKEVKELLIPQLSDPDPEIRSETALALARIGHPSRRLVEALTPLVSDDNKDVRANTGIALSVYGPDASSTLPDLQIMAEDEDQRLSSIAKAAIQAIQGQPGTDNK